jgi:hypothetical protein
MIWRRGFSKAKSFFRFVALEQSDDDLTNFFRVTKQYLRHLPQLRISMAMVMGRMLSETTDPLRDPPLVSKSRSMWRRLSK